MHHREQQPDPQRRHHPRPGADHPRHEEPQRKKCQTHRHGGKDKGRRPTTGPPPEAVDHGWPDDELRLHGRLLRCAHLEEGRAREGHPVEREHRRPAHRLGIDADDAFMGGREAHGRLEVARSVTPGQDLLGVRGTHPDGEPERDGDEGARRRDRHPHAWNAAGPPPARHGHHHRNGPCDHR